MHSRPPAREQRDHATLEAPLDATPDPVVILLLAFGAGLSVATIYYNQPILAAIAQDLRVPQERVGLVPTVTQLGYGAGIVLSAPLGDRLDRRKIILWKSAVLAVALGLAALSPSVPALAAASLVIGLFATIAQDFVPAAATLAPAASRGRTVGTVMTGLLLGILLSRLVSGAAAARFGWRAVFVGAAVSIALLALIVARRLPAFPPESTARYGELLRSMAALFVREPALRRAALTQSLLSVAFSGFWSTLAFAVAAPPYGLGTAVAGAFGLAGAAGALAAPIAGSLADRRGPRAVVLVGASLVLASFVAMGLLQGSLVVLVTATLVFDLGVQASLIAHQTIVYALEPAARSRLNALLVCSMFICMAAGSGVASLAFARLGWSGVCGLGALSSLAALVVAARAPLPRLA